jgi:hypothetical protein
LGLLPGITRRWKDENDCDKEDESRNKQRDASPSSIQSKSPERPCIGETASCLQRAEYDPTAATRASMPSREPESVPD